MKKLFAALALFAACVLPASAQEYYDIDVDVQDYPEMQPIPDSPVYYAPGVDSNYFFYDGLYWDYYGDRWYASPWYNGPWSWVDPVYVPTYVLWVPVAYYHKPHQHWSHWRRDRAPRWGEHWGRDWQARHNEIYRGRTGGTARAPLPDYQRGYNRANYPRQAQQQSTLHSQHYGYRPQEQVGQRYYDGRGIRAAQPQPRQVEQAPQRTEAPANPLQRQESPAPASRPHRGADVHRDRR
jgi:hypothetical protein